MPLPFVLAAWGLGAAATGGVAAAGGGLKRIKDAKQSVEENARLLEGVEAETTAARKDCEAAFTALGEAKVHALKGALLPFHDAFSRLKRVDLAMEVQDEGAPTLDAIRVVEAGRVTVDLASALGITALGTGLGAMASMGTTTAVGGLAAAGTGTAIGSLSGAAATNATLAWLGGGTLAAGGGGVAAGAAVLTGIAAAPALLVGGVFLHHKGRESRAKAETFGAEASVALAKHREAQAVLRGASHQAETVRHLLQVLTPAVASGAGWLAARVEVQDDWREFDVASKDRVRQLVALAMGTSELVHTPLMSEDGVITNALRDAVVRGQTLLG